MSTQNKVISYADIIRSTLDSEMSKDKNIFLIGEDIGVYGGAFGITKGLLEKYGKKRVVDTPMSEQAITGLAIGSAMSGLKPILEIMFMDFMTLIYDQLFNHASIFNYLSCGKVPVPMVIRTAAGAGRGYGTTHSKTLVAPLMNIPGIKIVAPARIEDVGGLLRSSIMDPNPVVFVEHKGLYGKTGEKKEYEKTLPIGKASVVRQGSDVLLISFSKPVIDCITAADDMEIKGISVKVIDLRTVKPIDIELISNEMRDIGRVVVVEEGYGECGVASEIIAKINDNCFYSLDAPVQRVCTKNVPISCCPSYENVTIPSVERIKRAIRRVMDA